MIKKKFLKYFLFKPTNYNFIKHNFNKSGQLNINNNNNNDNDNDKKIISKIYMPTIKYIKYNNKFNY